MDEIIFEERLIALCDEGMKSRVDVISMLELRLYALKEEADCEDEAES